MVDSPFLILPFVRNRVLVVQYTDYDTVLCLDVEDKTKTPSLD